MRPLDRPPCRLSSPFEQFQDKIANNSLPLGYFGGVSGEHWFGLEPQLGRDICRPNPEDLEEVWARLYLLLERHEARGDESAA